MYKIAITFLLAIVAGSASVSHAQDGKNHEEKQFNFGVMAGINISTFTEIVGQSSFGPHESAGRLSPMFGLHARYQLSRFFAIRTELFFSTRGGSIRNETFVGSTGDKVDAHRNYRLNYIEIPLLGEFDFMSKKPKERFHMRLAIGASYGFNVASTLRYTEFTLTGNPQRPVGNAYKVIDIDGAKKAILNAVGELSFDFAVGKNDRPVFVKLRYTGSLDEVYEEEMATRRGFETRMNTYSLIFGFHFLKN